MATAAIETQKLAVDGGPKVVTSNLVGWPKCDEDAIGAVASVLRSGKVNSLDRSEWNGMRLQE